jgi:hypothetical protein
MSRAGKLYSYVHRCGAVTVTRSALPQFARDLNLRPRDLASLIERMAALGQVRAHVEVLRFAAIATGNSAFGACQLTASEQTVPCPNLLVRRVA